jgi:hypothetical protein
VALLSAVYIDRGKDIQSFVQQFNRSGMPGPAITTPRALLQYAYQACEGVISEPGPDTTVDDFLSVIKSKGSAIKR